MTNRITTLTDISIVRILRMAVLSSLLVAAPHFAAGQSTPGQESLLVLQVREATMQFIDVQKTELADVLELPSTNLLRSPR
jgi:hypothetical protein